MGKLKIASLFCGGGGTDIGIEGGFTFNNTYYTGNNAVVVYANDIEGGARDIFEANFNLTVDPRDIRNISSDEIPDHDILSAGFPCQSFSIIAQNPPRLGCRTPLGKLFFEVARVLRDKQPICFIAENVKGLLSANNKKAFPLVLKEFRECGYEVNYKILNTAWFGVPQKRERVFIAGFRNDLGIYPIFPEYNDSPDNFVPLKEVLENEIDEKYFFSRRAVDGMMRVRQKMNKGRAQDINQPCNTVNSHLAKVSLNSTDPVLKIGRKYRRFTPREVARIQSFPDDFKLVGSEFQQYKALGNAIAPVVMWHVFRSIQRQLDDWEKGTVRRKELDYQLALQF